MAEPVSIRGYVRLEANGQPRSRPHVRLELPQQHDSETGLNAQSTGESLNDKGVRRWNLQSKMKILSLTW